MNEKREKIFEGGDCCCFSPLRIFFLLYNNNISSSIILYNSISIIYFNVLNSTIPNVENSNRFVDFNHTNCCIQHALVVFNRWSEKYGIRYFFVRKMLNTY
jgi:hypothetical protein